MIEQVKFGVATPVMTSVSDKISVLVHELDGYVRSKAFPEDLADATAHFQVRKGRTNRQEALVRIGPTGLEALVRIRPIGLCIASMCV